jgi:hypothetical protein
MINRLIILTPDSVTLANWDNLYEKNKTNNQNEKINLPLIGYLKKVMEKEITNYNKSRTKFFMNTQK